MLPLLLNRKLIVALKIELYDPNRPVNLTSLLDLLYGCGCRKLSDRENISNAVFVLHLAYHLSFTDSCSFVVLQFCKFIIKFIL